MLYGPFTIRLLVNVQSDPPAGLVRGIPVLHASAGEHEAWCNKLGAVLVKVGGRTLGIRPNEFEYVTLPPAGIPLAHHVDELA